MTSVVHVCVAVDTPLRHSSSLRMREVVSAVARAREGVAAASSGMSKFETRQREREETRKAALLAKRLEKEKEARPEETFQHFTQQFATQVKGQAVFFGGGVTNFELKFYTAIEDRLEVAKSLPEKERITYSRRTGSLRRSGLSAT